MRALKDLPDIHPLQKQMVTLDFGDYLPAGVTLTDVVSVTLETVVGDDATPASHLDVGPAVGTAPLPHGSGKTNGAILQLIKAGCIEGVRYKITAIGRTSTGDEPPLETFFNCAVAAT